MLVVSVQHAQHAHEMGLLRNAGPRGWRLLHDRKWVMAPAVASGAGRLALRALEEDSEAPPSLFQYPGGGDGDGPATTTHLRRRRRRRRALPWGRRCWSAGQPHVLVAVPYNAAMPELLQQTVSQ